MVMIKWGGGGEITVTAEKFGRGGTKKGLIVQ